MQISLIRHGRSDLQSASMNVQQFQQWLQLYAEAGIVPESDLPSDTVEAIRCAKLVASSTSIQAVQSASLVTNSLSFIQNPIFCEASLTSSILLPKWIKLKPSVWIGVNRAAWVMGYANHTESYLQTTHRAKQAADLLIGYALCYQKVALVGHGSFNAMIAGELKNRGWAGPVFISYRHWGCNTYMYSRVLEGMKQGVGFTVT